METDDGGVIRGQAVPSPGAPALSVTQPKEGTIRLTLVGLPDLPAAAQFALRRDDGTYCDPNGGQSNMPLPFGAPHRIDGDRLELDLPDLLWLTAARPDQGVRLEVWATGEAAPRLVSAPWQVSDMNPPTGSDPRPVDPEGPVQRPGRLLRVRRWHRGPFEIDPVRPNRVAFTDLVRVAVQARPAADGRPAAIARVVPDTRTIAIDLPAGAGPRHRMVYELGLRDGTTLTGDIRVLLVSPWPWPLVGLLGLLLATLTLWLWQAPIQARDDRVTLAPGAEAMVDFLANDRLPQGASVVLPARELCGIAVSLVGSGGEARARLVASADATGDCTIPYRLTRGGQSATAVIRTSLAAPRLRAQERSLTVPFNGVLAIDLVGDLALPEAQGLDRPTVELDRDGLVGELREQDGPGRVLYIAPYGVEQVDRFRYRLHAGGASSNWAGVKLHIVRDGRTGTEPPEPPPVVVEAVDDSLLMTAAPPLTFDLLGNDRIDATPGAPRPTLTLTRTDPKLTAVLTPDDQLRIDQVTAGATGTAELAYRLTQGSQSDTARVTIDLPPVAEALRTPLPVAPPPGAAAACRARQGEPALILIPEGQYARPAEPGTELARGLDAIVGAGIDLGRPDEGFLLRLEQGVCIQREEVSRQAYLDFLEGTPGSAGRIETLRRTMDQLQPTMMRMPPGQTGPPVFALSQQGAADFARHMQNRHQRDYRLPRAREWLAALLYAHAWGDRELERSLRRRVREFSADRTPEGRALALGPSEAYRFRWVEQADPKVPVPDAGLRLARPPEAP